MYRVFDLDGTVINSEHRKAALPDGTLDLAHWKKNNTPEKIHRDTVLPLIKTLRNNWQQGHTIILCTARVLGDADYEWFMEHNILSHHCLSRPDGCNMPDAELKDIQLRIFAQNEGLSWANFCSQVLMYDDAISVIEKMTEIGIDCMDAQKQNRLLRWATG